MKASAVIVPLVHPEVWSLRIYVHPRPHPRRIVATLPDLWPIDFHLETACCFTSEVRLLTLYNPTIHPRSIQRDSARKFVSPVFAACNGRAALAGIVERGKVKIETEDKIHPDSSMPETPSMPRTRSSPGLRQVR